MDQDLIVFKVANKLKFHIKYFHLTYSCIYTEVSWVQSNNFFSIHKTL